jgi:GNAT superfamily N-acetyltransferase
MTELSVEPFRGDFEGLEKMAYSSWRDEYGISSFPNFYRPAFLRYLFGRTKEKDYLIAAYRGGEIVSFLGNIPHAFQFRGRVYRGTWSCLLVTRKELLRQGHAVALINEALRINQKYKYDFALATFETGHRSTLMLLEWMKRIRVIARILDMRRVGASEGLKTWEKAAVKLIGGDRRPKKGGPAAVREYRPGDLTACLALFNSYRDKIELARVWEPDELGWELDCTDVAQTLVYEKNGHVTGAINFLYHDHLGKTKERWAWINHVAYPDLAPRERFLFIQAFLRFVRARGCIGVIEWTKHYYSLGPLYRSHFFPYFRSVNLYSWTFNPEISLSNVRECNEILV